MREYNNLSLIEKEVCDKIWYSGNKTMKEIILELETWNKVNEFLTK